MYRASEIPEVPQRRMDMVGKYSSGSYSSSNPGFEYNDATSAASMYNHQQQQQQQQVPQFDAENPLAVGSRLPGNSEQSTPGLKAWWPMSSSHNNAVSNQPQPGGFTKLMDQVPEKPPRTCYKPSFTMIVVIIILLLTGTGAAVVGTTVSASNAAANDDLEEATAAPTTININPDDDDDADDDDYDSDDDDYDTDTDDDGIDTDDDDVVNGSI